MTIEEKERFYKTDLKQYVIHENSEFILWLENNKTNENYSPIINNDEIQHFIDYLTKWYELKYPEKYFYFDDDNLLQININCFENIIKNLDFKCLKSRLFENDLALLNCDYREDISTDKIEIIHELDFELRKKILQFTALKILYSENAEPEIGYARAMKFINEFKKNIPKSKLSEKEINKIVQTDYRNYSSIELQKQKKKSKKINK